MEGRNEIKLEAWNREYIFQKVDQFEYLVTIADGGKEEKEIVKRIWKGSRV